MEGKRNPRGMGSFKDNPNGSVTHSKCFGFLPSGARRVFTVTASSRSECIKLMRQKELAWLQNSKPKGLDKKITVVDLCEQHLEYQTRNRELTNKSWDRRETTIQRHIGDYGFGRMQAASVTARDVEEHIAELISGRDLSASSIKKVLDVLNAAYTWSCDRGDLADNPVAPIKKTLMKRISKLNDRTENEADVIVMSDLEQRRFEEYVKVPNLSIRRGELQGLYGLFLLKTGLRVGEFCACHWHDYDEQSGILTINKSRAVVKNRGEDGNPDRNYIQIEKSTKNQKARKIELFDEAKDALSLIRKYSRWTKPEDFIGATRMGKPNTDTNLEHRMKKVYRDAGIFTDEDETGSLHILRRTFATDCYYNKGIPLKTIAAYMGDRPETIMTYYIAARERTVSADGEVQQVIRIKGYDKR